MTTLTTPASFTQFCLDAKVLEFGEYTLKSGRKSPYFFNFGSINDGQTLAMLGQHYANKIVQANLKFDMLFGPAYKGIPIATTTATSLFHDHGINVSVGFNRKEIKQHADKGPFLCAKPRGRLLLIDDVLTSGLACAELIGLLENYPEVEVVGLLVGLDRMERSQVRDRLPIHALANLSDIVQFITEDARYQAHLADMKSYYQQYATTVNSVF